jgi:hypothetical protein
VSKVGPLSLAKRDCGNTRSICEDFIEVVEQFGMQTSQSYIVDDQPMLSPVVDPPWRDCGTQPVC